MKVSFKKLLRSFCYAFYGIKFAFSQQNFFLMFVTAIGTLCLGFLLKISYFEWLVIILIIGLVLSLEALNTTWEKTLDFLEPNLSKEVEVIKNLVAGAILISGLTALVLGFIIFLPKILLKF